MSTASKETAPFHRIRWIAIVGGFMDGSKIEFAPGLNCIIGARGTGKTTAPEFIRFAVDAMPDDREACKRIEALVNRNLDFGRYNLFARGGGGYHFTDWMDVRVAGQPEPQRANPAPTVKLAKADGAAVLNDRKKWILEQIEKGVRISQKDVIAHFRREKNPSTIKRDLKELREEGLIATHEDGYYMSVKEKKQSNTH